METVLPQTEVYHGDEPGSGVGAATFLRLTRYPDTRVLDKRNLSSGRWLKSGLPPMPRREPPAIPRLITGLLGLPRISPGFRPPRNRPSLRYGCQGRFAPLRGPAAPGQHFTPTRRAPLWPVSLSAPFPASAPLGALPGASYAAPDAATIGERAILAGVSRRGAGGSGRGRPPPGCRSASALRVLGTGHTSSRRPGGRRWRVSSGQERRCLPPVASRVEPEAVGPLSIETR